ncbi:MAG: NUDIX hydrolase, partial [Hoeflea sp.]|nr:NUDIX hydrolase [Hoeflea sp.]
MSGSGIPENQVFSLDAVRLSVDPAEHPWRLVDQAAIEAHWAREQVERPFLYNGTILLHRGLRLDEGVISGISHRAPYAAILHWVKTQPQADVWHLFGSAVMLSADGAMMLIRMAARTANAGKVYAPAGTL